MESNQDSEAVAGWKGGFSKSELPDFAYPNPDLSSLPMLCNMANISLLQRQQAVKWPEFSWETVPGTPSSRCYQMFAPDISRLGYTDVGRVYSIICPQQGAVSPSVGSINVEVTVTGQRGWVNETDKQLAADMTVEAKIWFAPSAHQNELVKILWDKFANNNFPFPSNKANAIRISTHKINNPKQPIFPLHFGESTGFKIPDFAKHPEAWAVGNLSVQIGLIVPTGSVEVDAFNAMIMHFFNTASGNMLKSGNILSWNVWFTPPELVDQEEWSKHAERWRESIQADHGSPEGEGTDAKYFDGTLFKAGEQHPGRTAPKSRGLGKSGVKSIKEIEAEELVKIEAYLKEHF